MGFFALIWMQLTFSFKENIGHPHKYDSLLSLIVAPGDLREIQKSYLDIDDHSTGF